MLIFGRDVLGSLADAETREWLVTNGIGGYASGTIPGILTRHYHGLLVAALEPPLGRTVLITKIDEAIEYGEQQFALASNKWEAIPEDTSNGGWRYLERFYLDGSLPVWIYALDDALLEKRLWMPIGSNTSYVRYTLLRGSHPMTLYAKVIGNHRNFHGGVRSGDWQMTLGEIENGLRVDAFYEAVPYFLRSDRAQFTIKHEWYNNYFHTVEQYRGLQAIGDNLYLAEASTTLEVGESVTLVFSTEETASLDGDAILAERQHYESSLVVQSAVADEPDWIQHLVLAADQFIVKRQAGDNPDGRSVIAGYHWFGDWGRDTMISLPGLTLTTGRYDEAARILRTFSQYVDEGMLPNRFPDEGENPEYNTVDATLWYFEAIRAYYAATEDKNLLYDLYPVLQDIIAWHQRGTRYNIHMDEDDSLIHAGVRGVQLTWMDAKVGNWVVTPRIGKPIEINALWYNALRSMTEFAEALGEEGTAYNLLAERVQASFGAYWNYKKGYCYDVIDTPEGHDPQLRPNQLFAVSLHHSPLTPEQQNSVVASCAQHLLTSHGLRSLAPFEHGYKGVYGGNNIQRDGSYHQGTAWGWLIGPFVEAHLRVYGDKVAARRYLEPFAYHLRQQCVGSLAEIFDGDAPHTPRGATAQAWTVAEVLRVWHLTR